MLTDKTTPVPSIGKILCVGPLDGSAVALNQNKLSLEQKFSRNFLFCEDVSKEVFIPQR